MIFFLQTLELIDLFSSYFIKSGANPTTLLRVPNAGLSLSAARAATTWSAAASTSSVGSAGTSTKRGISLGEAPANSSAGAEAAPCNRLRCVNG